MKFSDIDMDISTSGERGKLYEAVFRNVKTGNIFSRVHFGDPDMDYENEDADEQWGMYESHDLMNDPFDARCLELYFCYGYGHTLGTNEIIFKEDMGLAKNWYCLTGDPSHQSICLGKRKRLEKLI
jgi:hypothetical protein